MTRRSGTPATPPRATLRALADELAPLGFDVQLPDRATRPVVGPLVVLDPRGVVLHDGCVLVAVGVDPAEPEALEVVARVGEAHGAAVVLGSASELPADLVSAARAMDMGLLRVADGRPWQRTMALIESALGALEVEPAGADHGGSRGDLFLLADAVARMLGGPVTIEDTRNHVLAYSSHAGPIDEMRRQTLMERAVPPVWLPRTGAPGTYPLLRHRTGAVYSPGDPEQHLLPRLEIAVRVGGEVLGEISVLQSGEPFPSDGAEIMEEAARIAGLSILQSRERPSPTLRPTWLRDLLMEGTVDPRAAARHGVQAGHGFCVAVVDLDPPGPHELPRVERALQLLERYLDSISAPAVLWEAEGMVYLLLDVRPERDGTADGRAGTMRVLRRALGYLEPALGYAPVVAAGRVAEQWSEVPRSRWEAEHAARVARERSTRPSVVHVDDVQAECVLLALRDLAVQHPLLRYGPVEELCRIDAAQGTDYVATLGAMFRNPGGVPSAAKELGLHPNTVRYRLRKIEELTGLRLDDPLERLVAQLQLHFLGERPA